MTAWSEEIKNKSEGKGEANKVHRRERAIGQL